MGATMKIDCTKKHISHRSTTVISSFLIVQDSRLQKYGGIAVEVKPVRLHDVSIPTQLGHLCYLTRSLLNVDIINPFAIYTLALC
jgi:hypothetical protein